MRNETITGWRVRNRFNCGCHVFDVPEDYRSVTIPKGAIGTLTGDTLVFPEGAETEGCVRFAADAEKIRVALTREMLPNHEEDLRQGKGYWEQTKTFRGDDLLASRIALVIRWDGICEQEPETLKCASYIPWLEFVGE